LPDESRLPPDGCLIIISGAQAGAKAQQSDARGRCAQAKQAGSGRLLDAIAIVQPAAATHAAAATSASAISLSAARLTPCHLPRQRDAIFIYAIFFAVFDA